MELKHAKRLPAAKAQADEKAAQALTDLPTYDSIIPELTTAAVTTLLTEVQAKRKHEQSVRQALNAALNELTEIEWSLHDTMQRVKQQATAQFGANSSEIEALGLKRKIDHKKRGPKGE